MKYATVVVGQFIRHSAEISLDALQILLQPLEPEQHSLTTWVVFGIQVVRRDDLLENTADHLTVVVLVRQYYTGELIVKLHAFAAPEPADHQPLPGTAFALHDAALAVTVDQLATTGRARRDGIIALNIKNRLPHCV